jgi:putative endonuclease
MGFLYILRSETSGRFYVGSTDHLLRRFLEHKHGRVMATRNRGPWNVIYFEQFATLGEARKREWEIKRWKSSKMIQGLVGESVD